MSEVLPSLSGVPRTALWTLWCRAAFADGEVLDDPEAIRIRDAIGGDLRRHLGAPIRTFAERAALFDRALQGFLDAHPGAAVVSLGEGLETQRYRVQGYGAWTSVDLAAVLAVRARHIPPDATHRHLAGSATDLAWVDALGPGAAFVVAQGLFMYLEESACAAIVEAAVSGAGPRGLIFDVVPAWLSALSRLRPPMSGELRVPRMPWGTGAAGLRRRVSRWVDRPVDVTVHALAMPAGPFPGRLPTVGVTVAAR